MIYLVLAIHDRNIDHDDKTLKKSDCLPAWCETCCLYSGGVRGGSGTDPGHTFLIQCFLIKCLRMLIQY